jgi:protoporphyrinogen oxidase
VIVIRIVQGLVLATVPSDVLAKIIGTYEGRDPEFFRKLRSIDYLDAVLQVFATKQKLTDFYWHNINSPDAPFVVFLSLTELVGAERFDGLNIYYVGAYVPREHAYMTGEPEAVKKRWYDELAKIFPHFDKGQIVDEALFRMRNAQHIVDIGFETEKLPPHQTPCPGVLMCNFSQIYPMDRGTNYAVRDGNRMAERLLESLGEKIDAGNIRSIAPASFTRKQNEVAADSGGRQAPESGKHAGVGVR